MIRFRAARANLCRLRQPWLLLVVVFFPVLCISAGAETDRPNIVLFLMDDHSQRDSTVYGAHDVHTPHMQRLAQDGITFTQAFVASPSCAPSRAVLLTGLMPARNGAQANHSKPRPEIKKLPAYLKELGYEVVAFGKVAHYEHGSEYGFDLCAFDKFHDQRGIPAAAEFLAQRRASGPLCLIVGTNWPHVPWPEPHERYDPAGLRLPPTHVDTPETRKFRARYYTAVSKADDDLGTVYEAARQTLGANTLFICTSDHGAQWPFAKWNLYDDGIRVPLIAAWPGIIAKGSKSDAMVSWIDLLPTLIEVSGGKPPQALDGRSFAAVLRGEKSAHREKIFATHSADAKMNVYPMRAVRTRQWKYIRNLHPEFAYTTHIDKAEGKDGATYFRSWMERAATDAGATGIVKRYRERPREELYALDADPFEESNLAADPSHAARLAELGAEPDRWMKETDDKGEISGAPRLLRQ